MKTRLEKALKTVDKIIEQIGYLPEDSQLKIRIKRMLIKKLKEVIRNIDGLAKLLDELKECECNDAVNDLLNRKELEDK